VLSLLPRVGFVLLLLALVAFEALFVGELRDGRAALETERRLRSERATEALKGEFVAAFDVAEARIEALETLPQLEDDGLYWVQGGLQRAPRVAGLATSTVSPEALDAWLDGALDAGVPGPRPSTAMGRLLLAWPRLERTRAATWCVKLQRLEPQNSELKEACRRGLEGTVLSLDAGAELSLESAADGGAWLIAREESEVHGARIEPAPVMDRVKSQLRRHGTLEGDDDVRWVSVRPLPVLELNSPRLANAERALVRAFTWKSALLALTAVLGLSVVLIARLAERREQATLALQKDFISTVSHELRTPLAAIRVMAETLERKLGNDGAGKDYPRRLVSATDGLTFLIDNILSFNRIEAGRLTPRPELVSLSTLEPLLQEDAKLALERPVQVTCEGLAALPPVHVDPDLFRIVVLNLLRNAWKHGVATPTFQVSGRVEGDEVVLAFADNGAGIPPEAHEAVFEAFHRLESSKGTRGAGLGLALARRIARLHQGDVRIARSSGEGTTFEVRLPRGRT